MARRTMTIPQVLSILEETPHRLRALTDDLSPSELQAAPEPGEWSVTEILAHLRSCAEVWGDAIEAIRDTDHPTIRAVNPTTWIEYTDYRELEFSLSFQAFSQQRGRLLAVLGPLAEQGWSRSATVLGAGTPLEATLHSYAERLARHERAHLRQVAKTVRALLSN